ncbi:MAG: hypothetical protein R3B68_11415 [Phycisphaerales bacterium]
MDATLDDASLLAQFEARTLPAKAWTHQAHLRVALLYTKDRGPDAAVETLRHTIPRLNDAHGVPNSETRGYHETITVAWVRVLASALADDTGCDSGKTGTLDWLRLHPDLLTARALDRHYSPALIRSPAARTAFVEPGLVPLPTWEAGRSAPARQRGVPNARSG